MQYLQNSEKPGTLGNSHYLLSSWKFNNDWSDTPKNCLTYQNAAFLLYYIWIVEKDNSSHAGFAQKTIIVDWVLVDFSYFKLKKMWVLVPTHFYVYDHN